MYQVLSLNGEWNLSGRDAAGNPVSVPVEIPGYAHPALEKAGIIEPIFWRDNAEKCQWVENEEWCFSRTITVPDVMDLTNAELRFGGVDTYADITLNGKLIYTTSNMFIPFTVPVGDVLTYGENTLCVTVHPYKQMIADKPKRDAAFTGDRVHVRRIQCTFFWDWVNRFVSAGIWGKVELAFPSKAVIRDVFAQTTDIGDTSASVRLRINTENAVDADCRFKVSMTDPDGNTAWDLEGRVFLDTLCLQADIGSPRLWWPVGYGEHPLYTLTVVLTDAHGNELDRKTQHIGIRTVRFEMLRDQPNSEDAKRTKALRERYQQQDNSHAGESFILLVNGQRIFCKGGNWVPASPFPGTVSDAHYRQLITLAAKANMNLLRVWGGGIYEPDIFYDLCDEAGVMVTQDFMLACGNYPDDDPEFIESFQKEVEATVLRLRRHPCLVAWLGNNENGDGFDWDDKNTKNIRLQDICRGILDRLDPNRPFRPYCPYGGIGNTDLTIGDDHLSWWWTGAENIDPSYFDFVGRFASESPLEGYSLPSVLQKFLCKEDILDPESPIVDYHIKNNLYFEQMGLISVHQRLKKNTEIIIGTADDPYQQLYRLAYIQYEWARLTLEGMRRSKWYAAGIQYWMYNDCWPALGYAVVDYYGRPKSGWYATKNSGAPLAATVKQQDGDLKFIILNDSLEAGRLSYRIQLYRPENGLTELLRGEADYDRNVNTEVFTASLAAMNITAGSNAVIFFELYRGHALISRARWYPDWLSKLRLPSAELALAADRQHNRIKVTCKSGIALGVAFDGELIADDNFMDILEGETREVAFTPLDGFQDITVYGYNIPITRL